jgi:hypothetical protein
VELLAHLDRKTGLRVICGSGDRACREELARIAIIQVGMTHEGRRYEPGERLLCMLDGWRALPTLTKGKRHWTQSKHAMLHAARTHSTPRLRRPVTTSIEDFDVLHIYGEGAPPIRDAVLLGSEGILATCPRCGHASLLTALELRVA